MWLLRLSVGAFWAFPDSLWVQLRQTIPEFFRKQRVLTSKAFLEHPSENQNHLSHGFQLASSWWGRNTCRRMLTGIALWIAAVEVALAQNAKSGKSKPFRQKRGRKRGAAGHLWWDPEPLIQRHLYLETPGFCPLVQGSKYFNYQPLGNWFPKRIIHGH